MVKKKPNNKTAHSSDFIPVYQSYYQFPDGMIAILKLIESQSEHKKTRNPDGTFTHTWTWKETLSIPLKAEH